MSREWRVTGHLVLRHAGLPFDWVEQLGAGPDLLAAADDVLRREADLRSESGDPQLAAAIRQCRPELVPGRLRRDRPEAVEAWSDALVRYAAAFEVGDADASQALRDVARREPVGHAVFLSNPDAYHHMLVPFVDREPPLNSRWRRVRRQLYTYLQRLCAKNETVSFFGPIGYGWPGPGRQVLLHRDRSPTRQVSFSHWAARQLRHAISRDRRLRPALRWRRTGRQASATGPAAVVVAAIGGQGATTAAVRQHTGLSADALAAQLRDLVRGGVLDLELGGDPYDPDPLARLHAQLARLPQSPARTKWLEQLTELERLRASIESGSFPDRRMLIPELERRFEAAADAPARRGAGQEYADRAVFFEECSSPFALVVGAETRQRWARELTEVLELCVAHGARTQAAARDRVFRAWPAWWPDRISLLDYAAGMSELFAASGSVFQPRHAPVYPATPDALARLWQQARDLPGDRYAVVDLCLRTADPDRLADAPLVLARVHHHLQLDGWLATMHPDRAAFAADAAAWIADRSPQLVGFDFGRHNKGFYLFPGRRVLLRHPGWTDADDAAGVLPEELMVHRDSGTVTLRDRDGTELHGYLPLSDMVKHPPYAALSHPQLALPTFAAGTTPERIGDPVVHHRRRWQVPTVELSAGTAMARFLQLRRLAARTGCRFVYCRTAVERKPYLLDLASPLAADLAGHLSRGMDDHTVEEMLPSPDELWLRDNTGNRYTCELRVQVIGRDGDV